MGGGGFGNGVCPSQVPVPGPPLVVFPPDEPMEPDVDVVVEDELDVPPELPPAPEPDVWAVVMVDSQARGKAATKVNAMAASRRFIRGAYHVFLSVSMTFVSTCVMFARDPPGLVLPGGSIYAHRFRQRPFCRGAISGAACGDHSRGLSRQATSLVQDCQNMAVHRSRTVTDCCGDGWQYGKFRGNDETKILRLVPYHDEPCE